MNLLDNTRDIVWPAVDRGPTVDMEATWAVQMIEAVASEEIGFVLMESADAALSPVTRLPYKLPAVLLRSRRSPNFQRTETKLYCAKMKYTFAHSSSTPYPSIGLGHDNHQS